MNAYVISLTGSITFEISASDERTAKGEAWQKVKDAGFEPLGIKLESIDGERYVGPPKKRQSSWTNLRKCADAMCNLRIARSDSGKSRYSKYCKEHQKEGGEKR